MTTTANDGDRVLMLRPWMGCRSGGDAYAHIDALCMRLDGGAGHRYSDYTVLWAHDDAHKTLRLSNFRFQCQIDNQNTDAYAHLWGYQPVGRSIFTAQDLELYGSSVAALSRGMDKLYRSDGPAGTLGRIVVRLAHVLKVGSIALLPISADGSFRDWMEIQHRIRPERYGDGIRLVDALVHDLRTACATRVGNAA